MVSQQGLGLLFPYRLSQHPKTQSKSYKQTQDTSEFSAIEFIPFVGLQQSQTMPMETELIVRYFGRVQPLAMQALRTLPAALPAAQSTIARAIGELLGLVCWC